MSLFIGVENVDVPFGDLFEQTASVLNAAILPTSSVQDIAFCHTIWQRWRERDGPKASGLDAFTMAAYKTTALIWVDSGRVVKLRAKLDHLLSKPVDTPVGFKATSIELRRDF